MIFAHTSQLTRSSRGFTLIELLVTVSIMVIMIGGSIAGFLRFRERQQVINVAKDVQQFLRTAQSKARVRQTPSDPACNGFNSKLQGYSVTITSGTTLTMAAICGPDATYSTANPVVTVETYTITGGVSLSPSSTVLNFYTLHRGTNLGAETTFTFTSGSYSYTFDVEPSGAISNVQ